MVFKCQPQIFFFARGDTVKHDIETRRQRTNLAALPDVHFLRIVALLDATCDTGQLIDRAGDVAGN